MKKTAALALILTFIISFFPLTMDRADALTKKRVKRTGYYRPRATYRTYQEYFLSPLVKIEDQPVILETLKGKGVASARFDDAENSLLLQFSSQVISALDIIKTLKGIGYVVTSIN